jgi:epoxyqueuosine reductase
VTQARQVSTELESILQRGGAALFGFADIEGLTRSHLSQYNFAVSFAMAMDPAIMASISNGPNVPYTELYTKVNERINALSQEIESALSGAGHQAWAVPASVRSDPANIRGDFPHKTAATRAGLGWIGKHAQLVTFELGPWLRLGTVLTSSTLPAGTPVERSFCGQCTACVEACPAAALHGADWSPGLERDNIFAPAVCDEWKKAHYQAFHGGHNCGICTSACPFGQKLLKKK